MIAGLSIDAFITLHVVISLIGIATGLVAMAALAAGRWRAGWQAAFLVTTALTSLTGFLFPFSGVTPAFVFGVVSLLLLVIAVAVLPVRARRRWAGIAYAVSATLALYLNLVVLVVQSFQKIPALQRLAPTQSEPPFLAGQVLVLLVAVALGWLSAARSRPTSLQAARG